MAKPDALHRLGGGRWETKDGRFQIEPQSGTWVIVDTTQTNEFGLPLVRGPYPSLGAAKEAIETARGEGPVTSPLAERIERASKEGPAPSSGSTGAKPKKAGSRSDKVDDEPEPPAPEPPPEPAWVRGLKPLGRGKALALIERLEGLGIDDAEAIARAEIADGEPALTRLAITRRIDAAVKSKRDPRSAAQAAIDALIGGEDDELEVGWNLVDDRGRRIDKIDLER
jgi:hypothetical protein